MATEHHQATPQGPCHGGEEAPSQQPGYARLAKRISAVTTNCLLTAIILIAGVGFGRQVLTWWADDASQPAAASRSVGKADELGDPSQLHVLQFGSQSWSLRRQVIAGDQAAAAMALRAVCREVLRRDRLPEEEPGEAESEFLTRLIPHQPVEQQPGAWRLYELSEAFPMVAGTRPVPAGADPGSPAGLSRAGRRVAIWGLAMPTGEEAWTLWTFQPEARSGGESGSLPEVPIPPECRKTLAMRVVGGGAITVFEGPGQTKSWVRFYSQWFAAHNWRAAGDWRHSGSSWYGRHVSQYKSQPTSVDVHIGDARSARRIGLIVINASRPLGGG